jgi:hypothetical protein
MEKGHPSFISKGACECGGIQKGVFLSAPRLMYNTGRMTIG